MIGVRHNSEISIECSYVSYLSNKISFTQFEGVWGELHASQLNCLDGNPEFYIKLQKFITHSILSNGLIIYICGKP